MTDSWRCTPTLSPEQRLEVLNLLNCTEVLLGREAIDEGRRRTVVHGWPAEHWLRYCDGALDAFALITGTDRATIEMCGGGFDEHLLDAVLGLHRVIDWWTRDDNHPPHGTVIRTLQFLRAELPVPVSPVPDGAVLRNFEPQHDEAAWLEQNNAAFADHPEQGAWLASDLAERTHEPWFDPSGFLLLEIDGRLAASCWTKVHELHPDRFGEIYVISVHPDFQGRHLGRVMVTQGLAVLRKKGVTNAVLFVDDSNTSARRLYESLGFKLEREDNLVRFERSSVTDESPDAERHRGR
jgi:ribosomal protein S18 acetylase RimI-like enzyme